MGQRCWKYMVEQHLGCDCQWDGVLGSHVKKHRFVRRQSQTACSTEHGNSPMPSVTAHVAQDP